ncbi:Rho termination factor N-terminal domain-containing protein [Paenibacillus glacialis]|uniref:Rho termination factor-like N-terminal domain-containing protein n=1 Tax=Paenibacillus glacialis TaxID=494026 RepID=A0A168DEK8_9BACL|nr:Rho termination factor N-terminal domain-containing protein [Paenibacillus glacialis]OAB34127.1 hypothetical protein PGLA_24850 [Paenibacillus glacialis]
MAYVTYRGTNASLTLHGIRFEPRVSVLIESESVLKKLRDQSDFEIREEKVVPLEDLTPVQLKDKAKALEVEGFSDMKKPELIKALTALEGKGQSDANTDDPPTT